MNGYALPHFSLRGITLRAWEAGRSTSQPGCKDLPSRHLGLKRPGLDAALKSSWNLVRLSSDDGKCPTKKTEHCGGVLVLEKMAESILHIPPSTLTFAWTLTEHWFVHDFLGGFEIMYIWGVGAYM